MREPPKGFVGVLRRFFASPRWVTGEVLHSGARLMDLLQMAAHRDGRRVKHRDGRQVVVVTLNRGEFIVGARYLAQRWGVGRTQVQRDLARWVSDGTLESVAANVAANVAAKLAVYRFANYGTYQPSSDAARAGSVAANVAHSTKSNKGKNKQQLLTARATRAETVEPGPTTRASWVTPYLDAYADHNGGVRPRHGPYLKALAGITQATGHSHERILRAWRDYLAEAAGQKWCSPWNFAEHYAEYDPDVPMVGEHGQLTPAGLDEIRRRG